MTDTFATERLTLRRFGESDVPVVTAAMQNRDVVAMSPRVPWSYTDGDARQFITDIASSEPMTFAVTQADVLIGAVSAQVQLGYWFVPQVWGCGFATEAARAVLTERFAQSVANVPSGHRVGNQRSRNVLTKLGFKDAGLRDVFCNAEGANVTLQDMVLSHADWVATS